MQLIQCLAKNDAFTLVEIENETSLAMAMNGTSIKSLSKTLSKKDIVKSISFFIGRFNENFNASGKFSDIQLATVSMDLFDIFQYETLEDVMLMFKYARQGKIGDGKDFKLDSQTIFHKWVPAYLELKSIEREKEHSQKKGELNGMSKFDWKKEDIEKFNVNEKLVNPTKLGQRMKAKFDVTERSEIVLRDRSEFLNDMFLNLKRMTNEQLKNYLIKSDVNSQNAENSIPFDPEVYEMVEKEIDSRL